MIRRLGFLPVFQISFDGYGTHSYMRGREGIEQGVIEAIRKVREAGFPVVISTSVDRVSKDSLTKTYDLLKELDIAWWRIAAPYQTGNWRGNTTAVSLEEEAEVYAPLLVRWLEDDKPFALELGRFFDGVGHDVAVAQPEPEIRYTHESYDCGACREKPYLLPDGTLLPCPGYTDTVLQVRMPNVLRDGLSEILSESLYRSIADMKKSDLLLKNEECATCQLFEACGMGCRAVAVAETGDLMAKDPITCALMKEGYKQRFRELADMAK